jgi:hypothetical protein
MSRRLSIGLALLLAAGPVRAAEPPPTGFQAEVTVTNPTRLDWRFAAAGFGPKAAQLPDAYDSSAQRYQLYVPPKYDRARAWPLVVFVSPGDDPLGWRFWQKPCEQSGLLFCAAYGAGNNCPPGRRIRIVLDMLDDVRRHYRIDPDQTYLCGFSGGGRVACTIAFALPEYFGGVVPVCGTNPMNSLDYLRHRVEDRLSVALVTGDTDFNRDELEGYLYPLLRALGVRARLWVVPKTGHAMPPTAVLAEITTWLHEGLKHRQAEAHDHPGLAVGPTEVPTPGQYASRQVQTAEAELRQPERTWRGAALLQGVLTRWDKTEAARRARKLLDAVQADPKQAARLAEQGGAEERRLLQAQAEGFERLGDVRHALQAWRLLGKLHPGRPEGLKAAAASRRLAAAPYLGIAFSGDTAMVAEVAPQGPADHAGVRAGDVVLRLAGTRVASPADVRKTLQAHQAGEKVPLEVRRGDRPVTLTAVLGTLPSEETPP